LKCNTKLTYSEVEAAPFDYAGKVLELKGTVGGSVTSEGRLSVMLNMDGGKAVMLDIPAEEAVEIRELSTPQLRALVQVKENPSGNVVSLQMLAVAYESTVAAEEKMIQARQDAERKRADWKRHQQDKWKEEMDRAMHHRSVATSPSRGSFQRPPIGISGIPPASQNLSARALPLYPAYYHFIALRNTKLTPAQVAQITFHLLDFADRFNVDPRLVVAMIIAESEFDPRSTSHSGAMGLGQLMPETARDLGVNNPYDIVQNLGGSINYLRSRLDMFAGPGQANGAYTFDQVALAMAAYNAGENAVKKYHGVPPYRETQAYVKRVTALYGQLCR
jgi:soluble lytic murein transglycosylase-like protein